MPRFHTTLKWALAGPAVGVVLCAVALVLAVAASAMFQRADCSAAAGAEFCAPGNIDATWTLRELSGLALPASALVASICLIVVLLWLPFHVLGWRHWSLAMLVGGVLFFLAWFLPHTDWLHMPLSGYDLDDHGWREAAVASAFAGVVGMLIAGAMWRTAYRIAPR